MKFYKYLKLDYNLLENLNKLLLKYGEDDR